ncbi:unnamed protein product [Clonostachys rosea f. rosea IK726]|uniref:Aminopeptidase n=3 Tax=Bionectria ochroleuca TaxID=29856 RepID=A0A0B7K5U9_BIOOC|nr:unnamed protein product [Clonostachys rosea f. rosea IK726]
MSSPQRGLLPTHLKATAYTLQVEPDFDKSSFSGKVEIDCVVNHVCQSVKLHSKSNDITKATIEFEQKTWDVKETVCHQEDEETIEISFPEQVSPNGEGALKITLEYLGKFRKDLTGLYQSTYETDEGVEQKLIATALEPTYAREVFPCFDEPALKAEFTISIIVDKSFVAVSNMPVERSEMVSSTKKRAVFQRSLPMSTYHIAIVAGPLAQVKSATSRIPLSVYCPIGTEPQAMYAIDLAAKGLQLFEDCFDSPYPLPKLDLIAVPDFSAGAMESWGAIMFRTTSLLLDPDDSALDSKQRVADMVLHEISHMWFGNLVTMKYWDGLWLKEGFAMLLAWYAADKLYPGWHVWDNYVANNLQKALTLDSLKSSHPVELLIQGASNAKQIYDEISYEKGSCILRMVLDDLGEDKFFSGLKLYLRRHGFQSTESSDLWKAWEEVSGEPLAARMHVWTLKAGFPVVHVTEQLDTEGSVSSYLLRQHQFLSSGPSETDGISDTTYPLRLAILSSSGVEPVDFNSSELVIPAPKDGTLFKVNAQHNGFFRTSYSSRAFENILSSASKGLLSLRDCIGLSCDLKALVSAGLNKTSELLDLVLVFRKLDSFQVWESIDRNLRTVQSVWKFHGPELNEALRKLARDILAPKAHEIGWDVSDEQNEQLVSFKTSMFSGAGLVGDEKVIEESRRLFADRVSGNESAIPGSLRWEVFGIVAAYGGLTDLEQLLQLWENSSNEDERYLALECLGRAPTSELMQWVLGHLLTKTVKDQDIYYLTWLVGSTSHGATELWNWTKRNWDRVEKAVPIDSLSLILGTSLDGLHSEDQVQDVISFFSTRETKSYQMVLDQKLESMGIRCRWASRDLDDVRSWLIKHGYLET